jgi:hypothetical protein
MATTWWFTGGGEVCSFSLDGALEMTESGGPSTPLRVNKPPLHALPPVDLATTGTVSRPMILAKGSDTRELVGGGSQSETELKYQGRDQDSERTRL